MHIAQALSTVQTLSPEVCTHLRVIAEVGDRETQLYFWCQSYQLALHIIELDAPDAKRVLDDIISNANIYCCGECTRHES